MDSIISSALEEICVHRGLTLSSLWHELKIDLSPGLKRAIWTNLINVPTIEFKVQNNFITSNHPSIQCFEDAQRLNLKIFAKQILWDHFLGLYDFPYANTKISCDQRRALERIAITRTNGITQKQLSDELGIERNKMGYEAKKLESSSLIVRQPAEERTKEACNGGELKNSSNVQTNLIHLPRYAKHLGTQQKFEITKEEQTMNTDSRENFMEHVLVKDYLPAMKAICDKLEEANGKVLVVSDIKRDLGYIGKSSRHRAWRTICNRLKNGLVVEEFNAQVNGKVECCLRLLKKFSPKNFQPKSLRCEDDEQLVKFGRRQNTEQLVDLSIEHQIYDMIDAKGSEGLNSIEVSQRLGIDNKIKGSRLFNLIKRFGMHLQSENHKRTEIYRVWTSGNFNLESSNAFPSRSKNVLGESSNLDIPDRSAETFLDHDPSTFEGDFATCGKMNDRESDLELSSGSPRGGKANHMILSPGNSQELLQEPRGKVPGAELDLVSTVMETNIAPSETTPPLLKPPKTRSYQRDPCQFLTADGARREQRILERLQEEKFILKAELYRWLVSLEKDKGTTMGRKTMNRSLHKLEQQGQCKCIPLTVPAIRNCESNCDVEVVLHPSVQSLSPKLINEVHDKFRSFKRKIHGQTSCKLTDNKSVPVLDGIQRSETHVGSNALAIRLEAMCANGYILGKMVRAKLLHSFLWNYISSSPGWSGALSSGKHVHDLKNPCSPQHLFDMEAAIKDIPLELFLQVMGTYKKIDDIIEKCKKGLRLSDLPVQEYKYLKDTQATGRLSLIISILQQLKLITLVTSGHSEVGDKVPRGNPVYAMELKTYIEEPSSIMATSLTLDLCPQFRHDFILSDREAVNEYWLTLEYCYATADQKAALHTFPGSAVHEVFSHRSWASVQSMTADQRAEVLKRIVKDDLTGKLPFKECKEIAKKLNLTLEQVLQVYNTKQRKRHYRLKGSSSQKRKRSAEARSAKRRRVDDENGQLGKQSLSESPDITNQFMDEENLSLTSPGKHGNHLQAYQENDHLHTVEEEGVNEVNEQKMKPKRQRRFSWTAEADRRLIIQYVRHRVALGAEYNRISWASIHDLPAPPSICGRRMAFLNQYKKFREALMRFCNMLSKRYEKHLERRQNQSVNDDDCRPLRQCSSGAGLNRNFFDDIEHTHHTGIEEERWDDFTDKNIKVAFGNVLRCKQIAIIEAYKRAVCVSKSQFPINTGNHAAKFSSWLCEREKDLKERGIYLPADLHYGDIYHLFALVSSGELSISPRLPNEGVGEAESTIDKNESSEGRREKGFPGIMLSVHLVPRPRGNSVECSKDGENCNGELLVDENYEFGTASCQKIGSISSHPDHRMETLNFESIVPIAGNSSESSWEAMAGYAECLMSVPSHQEQVNANDTIRVVDASLMKSLGRSVDGHSILQPKYRDIGDSNLQKNISMNIDDVHKVNILNHPNEVTALLNETHTIRVQECCMQGNVVLPGTGDVGESCKLSSADGTIDRTVYKQLRSHVFGIVMQNPGILEDDIICRTEVSNPQSCRKLLKLMVQDKFLIVRKRHQTTSNGAPTMLKTLFGNSLRQSKLICREHFFANPMGVSLLEGNCGLEVQNTSLLPI